MKTLQKQISLFGEEELTSSRVDFLANRTAQPESGLAKKTSDTCGPKCLESFGRFNHVGLWAKTFSALLIGTGDWYSRRCKLTWKLKGTKYNRLYFQLQASTLPTKGTEFGLWPTPRAQEPGKTSEGYGACLTDVIQGKKMQHLLKTPTAMDGEVTSGKKNPVSGNSGTLAQEIMSGYKPTMEKLGLLPTPTTMDMLPPKTDKAWEKEMTETRPGRTVPSNLRDVPFRTGLLKTPCAADAYSENLSKKEQKFGNSGTLAQEIQSGFVEKRWPGLLPTPTMYDYNSARHPELWEKDKKKYADKGINLQCGLKQMNVLGLLPTPTLQDARIGPNNIGGSQHRAERGSIALADIALGLLPTPRARAAGGNCSNDRGKGNLEDKIAEMNTSQTGTTSQLNPQFVLELMGFPPNFTELPFLNGETNQSRPPETPLCPK
jgi:hypothetical protein